MCEVILFPARPVRRDWSAARARVLAEGDWQRRITAEYKARAGRPFRPLLLSAWAFHVRQWRQKFPECGPDDVSWTTLWTLFLRTQPEGIAR